MIKKLSELDNKTLLLAGDNVITKEDILSDLDYYREKYKDDLYTTEEYHASIIAEDALDSLLENEYINMYEDWYEGIWDYVEDKDLKDLQTIFDRIFARNKEYNTSYSSDEKIKFDL